MYIKNKHSVLQRDKKSVWFGIAISSTYILDVYYCCYFFLIAFHEAHNV